MKSECKAVIKLEETHTALLGADEPFREVTACGKPVYSDGKLVREIDLRVAYILRGNISSVTLGLRLPQRRTTAEYNTFSDEFKEGDLVSALVVEEKGAYRIVELVSP